MTPPLQIWDSYRYQVTWSFEEEAFIATCVELPSLSALAPNAVTALQSLLQLVVLRIVQLQQAGDALPAPIAQTSIAPEAPSVQQTQAEAIARSLFDSAPLPRISEKTGLSIAQLKALIPDE